MNAQNSTRARMFRRSLMAMACFAAAAPAFAQTAAAPAPPPLPPIRCSAWKSPAAASSRSTSRLPRRSQVIRREDIRKSGVTNGAGAAQQHDVHVVGHGDRHRARPTPSRRARRRPACATWVRKHARAAERSPPADVPAARLPGHLRQPRHDPHQRGRSRRSAQGRRLGRVRLRRHRGRDQHHHAQLVRRPRGRRQRPGLAAERPVRRAHRVADGRRGRLRQGRLQPVRHGRVVPARLRVLARQRPGQRQPRVQGSGAGGRLRLQLQLRRQPRRQGHQPRVLRPAADRGRPVQLRPLLALPGRAGRQARQRHPGRRHEAWAATRSGTPSCSCRTCACATRAPTTPMAASPRRSRG